MTSITENSSYTLAGFAYDALGRRTTLSRGPSGGLASTGYGYDGLDRLNALSQSFSNTGNNLTLGLTRSPSDQLAGKSFSNTAYAYIPPAGSTGYSANGLNQYSAVAGTRYSYDGRGNLTSDGTRAFTYDLDNRLLTGSAPTPVSLTYDPLGRLQTSTASGSTTNFLYDGTTLVAEYDNSGNILNRYVPGPGTDEPLVWYAGTGTTSRRWLHADDLGSIIGWSDTTGTSQATYGYDPFGQPGSAWSGPRYSYTGQLMIPEAHLYNYKARVYDPRLGRFMQTDPIGYASDINAYAYVGNDPVNKTDPTGNQVAAAAAAGCAADAETGCVPGAIVGAAVAGCAMSSGCRDAVSGIWNGIFHNDQAKDPPSIKPDDLKGKTADEIRDTAKDKGLVPDSKNPDKFRDPDTGKERMRVDPGHVDKTTGKPYDNPNAAGPHAHGYEPDGKTPIRDPETGDKHFPIKPDGPNE